MLRLKKTHFYALLFFPKETYVPRGYRAVGRRDQLSKQTYCSSKNDWRFSA